MGRRNVSFSCTIKTPRHSKDLVRYTNSSASLLRRFRYTILIKLQQREADVHIFMVNATRKTSESITSYYHRMCAIGRRGGISEQATMKYIQNGLCHTGVQNAVAGLSFNNCLDMYSFLCRYENNTTYRNESITNNIIRSSVSPPARLS